MIIPKWPMWARIALGVGLVVIGGLVALADAAAAKEEPSADGNRW